MIRKLKWRGNSRILVLPKEWLDQLSIEGLEIDAEMQHGRIVLSAPKVKKRVRESLVTAEHVVPGDAQRELESALAEWIGTLEAGNA